MQREVLVSAVAIAALLGCQTPTWQQKPTTNKPRRHVMVQFTDSSLHPSIARVLEGGDVSWVNYATMYVGAVVFPASTRESFTCSQLRPRFMKVAAGYQSIPIGGDMVDFALPCPLSLFGEPTWVGSFAGLGHDVQ
jgi:hypothetical protein